jgi:hypothetical protein
VKSLAFRELSDPSATSRACRRIERELLTLRGAFRRGRTSGLPEIYAVEPCGRLWPVADVMADASRWRDDLSALDPEPSVAIGCIRAC